MKSWQKWYYGSMALSFVLFVLGELIWLPDPVRFGSEIYWIDILDWLVYLLAAIPFIWAFGAALKLLGGAQRWDRYRSIAVLAAGILSALAIIFTPKQLVVSLGLLGLVWILVFADLIFSERKQRKVPVRSLWSLLITVCLLALLLYPTPYLVTYPGLTLDMNRYAEAQGGKPHDPISGVLVFERPAFPIDWLYARIFPHYSFERIEKLGMSLGAYNRLSLSMKQDANAAGSAIAYQQLGLGSGITSHGVEIAAVLKNSPAAAAQLQPGDIITKLNGVPVSNLQELSDRMQKVKPGESVQVEVTRGGKQQVVTVGTGASKDDPKRAAFGIQVENNLRFDIPRPVRFHNYLLHEGGPSHGAILALTLIDQLTPGGVTNGNRVAGTGTIEPDGSVGIVGGVEQKAYTVGRSGADVFFVPYGNLAEALKGATDGLKVVPVHTLDDMLTWLKTHPKRHAP